MKKNFPRRKKKRIFDNEYFYTYGKFKDAEMHTTRIIYKTA